MQRVVGIAAFIMGLLLIGLTVGLMAQRRGSSPPEVVVIDGQQNHQILSRLTLVLRDGSHEIAHATHEEASGLYRIGPSPDGQWLYVRVVDTRSDGYHLSAMRIRLDGLKTERLPLPAPYTSVFWSPDGQWLIYEHVDTTKNQQPVLIRAAPDGSYAQNLTGRDVVGIEADYPFPPIISPDNDWIVVSGFDVTNRVYHIDLTTGKVTCITNKRVTPLPTFLWGYFHNVTGDWLVVTRPDGVFRMRLDGSALTPLMPLKGVFNYNVTLWPDARLILFQREDTETTLYAVSMDDYSLRWSLPQMVLTPAPLGRTHVLGFGAEGAVYAIDAKGHAKQVAPLFANMPTYQWSPDERWLVYTMGSHLYAVTLPDGAERDLYSGTNRVVVLEWADDGESVVIMEDTGAGFSLWRVGLADGHKQPMMAYREGVQYLGIGRLHDWEVDGFGLLAIGCILTAVSAVRLERRRKA